MGEIRLPDEAFEIGMVPYGIDLETATAQDFDNLYYATKTGWSVFNLLDRYHFALSAPCGTPGFEDTLIMCSRHRCLHKVGQCIMLDQNNVT